MKGKMDKVSQHHNRLGKLPVVFILVLLGLLLAWGRFWLLQNQAGAQPSGRATPSSPTANSENLTNQDDSQSTLVSTDCYSFKIPQKIESITKNGCQLSLNYGTDSQSKLRVEIPPVPNGSAGYDQEKAYTDFKTVKLKNNLNITELVSQVNNIDARKLIYGDQSSIQYIAMFVPLKRQASLNQTDILPPALAIVGTYYSKEQVAVMDALLASWTWK